MTDSLLKYDEIILMVDYNRQSFKNEREPRLQYLFSSLTVFSEIIKEIDTILLSITKILSLNSSRNNNTSRFVRLENNHSNSTSSITIPEDSKASHEYVHTEKYQDTKVGEFRNNFFSPKKGQEKKGDSSLFEILTVHLLAANNFLELASYEELDKESTKLQALILKLTLYNNSFKDNISKVSNEMFEHNKL